MSSFTDSIVIAGAGMAAALPGVVAAKTRLPVLGVPMESKLDGLDSLLSISQMPPGIPVGTLAVGRPGAINAGLLAAAILIFWGISGFYRVQPDEQGLVLRFGAFDRTTLPGLNYHMPWPIEGVRKLAVTRINRVEVGYRSAEGELMHVAEFNRSALKGAPCRWKAWDDFALARAD